MNNQYPNLPPNYHQVPVLGGYQRDCFVIEVLSLQKLSAAERAIFDEQITGTLSRLVRTMGNLERCTLHNSDTFDTILRAGLRL